MLIILLNFFCLFLICNANYSSDVGLNVVQLIEKNGYVCETHYITTEDGYILTFHRIPHGISNTGEKRRVVLLLHGLGTSSADYVNMGKNRSLAYLLADTGYDVWLGNSRGNVWSRNHTSLDVVKDAQKFFDFSWHEMGYYDLPASIDYILNLTGNNALYYIGHSQGCTAFFVLLTTRPEYNFKIKMASLMAPASINEHHKDDFFKLVSAYIYQIEALFKTLRVYEIPYTELMRQWAMTNCGNPLWSWICQAALNAFGGGADDAQIIVELLPVIGTNAPSNAAIKQMIHFGQQMRNERLNVLYEKNWTRLVTEQLKRFERAVVESSKADGASNPAAPHWTFGGALLYSLTLLTTVGYGRLSPRTALGKVVAVIYALIGVPLMLVLLSALGAMFASAVRKAYSRLCCQHDANKTKSPSVGYHKAPSSPSGKLYCKTHEDSASIQIASSHSTPNHNCKSHQFIEHGEVPKRALLATVRASHARGRCRQTQVRQMLADSTICPTHCHGTPTKSTLIIGSTSSDIDDADDADESERVICSHDTPSRVPLIWRGECPGSPPPSQPTSPSVPASLVLFFFFSYVCVGAAAFASTSGWSFLDATYFCFIALSTIGIGDKLPQSGDTHAQFQLLACCLYLFLGLVIVAMCFSLVHEEISTKCRHIANNMGLLRH